LVPVRSRRHSQAHHCLLHRPGTSLVQNPAVRARHIRRHVRGRYPFGNSRRYGACAERRRWYCRWNARSGSGRTAGAGCRHAPVRRVF